MTNSTQENKHESDTLDMHSPNLVDDNVQKIMALFPNCITESEDQHGKLKKAVDFDLLRQELSQSLVEGGQERYRLDWPGKRQAILEANSPIAKTLRPARDESVNFDTTENLFIEGDNLEALKLLQESYLGQVKMIYIDPPYNTGNDFIYDDDFSEDTANFLERSEQIDEEGNRLVTNTESNGRFHSDWLTMMYSRLKLARNLLSDNGLIFISINDKEVHNLKKICDEVFGSDNFIVQFVWRTDGNFDNQAKIKNCHEYVLLYALDKELFDYPLVIDPNVPKSSKLYNTTIRNTVVKNGKKNPPSKVKLPIGFPTSFESGVIKKSLGNFPYIYNDAVIQNFQLQNEITIESGWSSKELLMKFIENDFQSVDDSKSQKTKFSLTATGAIEAIKDRDKVSHVVSVITGLGGSQKANAELEEIDVVFDDYPKPRDLVEYFIKMNNDKDFCVLDFFAGSSTTAHSVISLNYKDNGRRRFIMVQVAQTIYQNENPNEFEFCISNSLAPTIAEISKERIRRAGQKILADNQDKDGIEDLDIGFRVLKIDSTNMKDVYYTPDNYEQATLDNLESHIKEDRTGEDLLFQVMLDWGVPLSLPIEVKEIKGSSVYYVGIDSLVACFDTLSTNLIDEISKDKPLKFVSSELAIAHDQDKTNIKARFAQLSPDTQVKFI